MFRGLVQHIGQVLVMFFVRKFNNILFDFKYTTLYVAFLLLRLVKIDAVKANSFI